jgi:chromatin structure-remodeling complex subunit RSC9
MSLSLRSGILGEVAWALDRLCRLCHNDQFVFRSIPGLIDGLFDWPEWYATSGYKNWTEESLLFSPSRELTQKRRFALESLFVLRNAALNETNAYDLAIHTHTMPFLLNTLLNLDGNKDENVEFTLYALDIFQVLSPRMVIHSHLLPTQNPLPPLLNLLHMTSNRSMIISTLTALTTLFSNPSNVSQLTTTSPALAAAIRYLPLFMDIPLVDACLNYLYAHISHPPFARAFLLHSEMPSVLKLLASFILHEQSMIEENVSVDVTGPVQTASPTALYTKDHELTEEELGDLLEMNEPQRCYEWYVLPRHSRI